VKLSKANNRSIRRRSGESDRVRDAELVSEYASAGIVKSVESIIFGCLLALGKLSRVIA